MSSTAKLGSRGAPSSPTKPKICIKNCDSAAACRLCSIEDNSVKLLVFRGHALNAQDDVALALCRWCRHKTLEALAAEVAEDPDVEEWVLPDEVSR
jgi:hypothetical protein